MVHGIGLGRSLATQATVQFRALADMSVEEDNSCRCGAEEVVGIYQSLTGRRAVCLGRDMRPCRMVFRP